MKKVALFLILFLGAIIIYSQFSKPTSYSFNFQKVLLEARNLGDDGLKTVVEEVVKEKEGRYGVYIKNLKTNQLYVKDENVIFEPASLYKIWVMGAVFTKIKEGEITESDRLTADIANLNKIFAISDQDAELKTGVINFSIKSALEQMITISHNYAAMTLTEKVGSSEVKKFMRQNGFTNSDFDYPLKTTALEFGLFFERLYKGEVIDQEFSQKMVELLLKQQRNDRIPKYLPDGTRVAHKTGELDSIRNDGGIIYTPNGDLIMVVLTETNNVVEASELIAQLSKAVYEYFSTSR